MTTVEIDTASPSQQSITLQLSESPHLGKEVYCGDASAEEPLTCVFSLPSKAEGKRLKSVLEHRGVVRLCLIFFLCCHPYFQIRVIGLNYERKLSTAQSPVSLDFSASQLSAQVCHSSTTFFIPTLPL